MGKEEKVKKSKKEKKSKDKHKKDKKDRKEKEHKKKPERRHSRHSNTSSSSSDSSSEDEALTPAQQLRQERAAVAAMRQLLWHHNAARKELRELLWTVDQGKGANISGIADMELKERLRAVLKLLRLKRAGSSKDIVALPKGAPATLSIVGFCFEEAPQAPPAPKQQPAPARAPVPAPAPSLSPSRAPASPPEPHTTSAGMSPDTVKDSRQDVRPQQQATSSSPSRDESEEAAPAPARRVVGPAMPSAEMLAAAAAAAEANAASDEGPGPGVSEGMEVDDDDGMLVGPPPPEMVEEMDALPEDTREAEVVRIARVLRDAKNVHAPNINGGGALTAPAPGSLPDVDAYAVLGVAPDVPVGDIKKRYMRLSLLIHPDKCAHKDAHTAFQAVAVAAKTLQDGSLRAALDAAREDKELRRMAEAAARAEATKHAWRVARGEVPAGPAPGAAGLGGPLVRESWMTELPPEMQANLAGDLLNQVSKRAFSAKGVQRRGDTSEWTDTPTDRATKAQQAALGQAQGPLRLTAGSGSGGGAYPGGGGGADAKLLDAYNSAARKKTLLELHVEAQEAAKAPKPAKKKAKVEGPAAAGKGPSVAGPSGAVPPAAANEDDKAWVGNHPWRPFDRDKDLELKPKALDPAKILAAQQGVLGSKFKSSGGSRHFL